MANLQDRLQGLRTLLSGRRPTVLFVDGSMVACPLQGDISIEHCLACGHLTNTEGDPLVRIECRPGPDSMVSIARQPTG